MVYAATCLALRADEAMSEMAAGRVSNADRLGEARWRVTTEISAQLPLKLLGFLARVDLIARHVSLASVRDSLDIVILADGVSESSARIIESNIRAVIGVYSAELFWRPR